MGYTHPPMRQRARLTLVYGLFLLSGSAGLVYQVVWSRLFADVFGITAYAVTAVLATFLGGLALGAWWLGRFADRTRNPLGFYGLLEMGIGVSALAGTYLITAMEPLHVFAATRLAPNSGLLLFIRCVIAGVVIIPATVLMGGTLPAITRFFVGRIGHLGRRVSLLYALNTCGAVLGCIAAGFVLIRAIGLHPTVWAAAGVNIAIGALSLGLASRSSEPEATGPDAIEPNAPSGSPAQGSVGLLIVMALSGVASISLEVIWTRVLVLVVGTSTYAFVTMLASFLVGIALGSFLARMFIDRLIDCRRAFGWIQMGIAASNLASILLARKLMSAADGWLAALELDWLSLSLGRFGLSFLVLLVPTCLIGMTFPIAAKMWANRLEGLGGRLGQLYGANTLGNILGAFAGGFLVLPLFGMQKGIAIITMLNLAAAAWGLLPAGPRRARTTALLRTAPVFLGLAAAMALLAAWRPEPLPATGGGREDPVLYYREGLVSTVKVIQRADDARQLLMFVDGVSIGQSSTGVDKKQQILAHLPFLLSGDRPLRNVLTIGLGTGILSGEVLRHPGVERLECVEISPSVIESSSFFSEYNGDVLRNAAFRLINDDGVTFLKRSPTKYDAIISDGKSKSGHAGNAVFYSRDFYAAARSHLAPRGILIQWVPFDVGSEDLEIVIRTFVAAFPYSYSWLGEDSCFLVGTEEPLSVDLLRMQLALAGPEYEHLRRHGWNTSTEIASLLIGDGESMRPWLSRGRLVNSLEQPVLEFYRLDSSVVPTKSRVAASLATFQALGPATKAPWSTSDERAVGSTSRAVRDLMEGQARLYRGEGAVVPSLRKAAAAAPDRGFIRQLVANAFFSLGNMADAEQDADWSVAFYSDALAAWPEFVEAHVNIGRAFALRKENPQALVHLRRALELNPGSSVAHKLLGELYLQAFDDPASAMQHQRAGLRIAPGSAVLHSDLGLSLASAGRIDEALAEYRDAMRLDPELLSPMPRAAALLLSRPGSTGTDAEEARRLAARAAVASSWKDPGVLETLAAALAAEGKSSEAALTQRRAIDLVAASGDRAAVARMSAQLDRYQRQGSP